MLKTDNLKSLDSGMYKAVNEDGKEILIMRQVGQGWAVYTPTHNGWYQIADYDESGSIECERYTKMA